jgi:hypothetical protein
VVMRVIAHGFVPVEEIKYHFGSSERDRRMHRNLLPYPSTLHGPIFCHSAQCLDIECQCPARMSSAVKHT